MPTDLTTEPVAVTPDCDICGQPYFRHQEIVGAGPACPRAVFTYRAPRLTHSPAAVERDKRAEKLTTSTPEPAADVAGLCERLEEAFERARYGGDGPYNPDGDLFDVAADALASLSAQLGEARELLARWQTWACGQRGASPFQDVRDFLARQDQGK